MISPFLSMPAASFKKTPEDLLLPVYSYDLKNPASFAINGIVPEIVPAMCRGASFDSYL
jgi:hypothetical protein